MSNDFKWGVAYASVIGNSHIGEGLPCQDACLLKFENGYGIAIVSDGAGSCTNSHIGSGKVCSYTHTHLRELVEKEQWAVNKHLPSIEGWKEFGLETLFKVKTDLVELSIQEDIDFKSLSCTLMAVVFFSHGLLLAQIGDGRGGYHKDGIWKGLFTPSKGEFANETVFITSQIWEPELMDRYINFTVIDAPVDAFCLLTDGCERAAFQINLFDEAKETYYDPNLPYPNFFNPLVGTLKGLIESKQTQTEINDLWASFLTNGNPKFEIETDDKTMILAVNLSGITSETEVCQES